MAGWLATSFTLTRFNITDFILIDLYNPLSLNQRSIHLIIPPTDDAIAVLAAADAIRNELATERESRVNAITSTLAHYKKHADFTARWTAAPERIRLEQSCADEVKEKHNAYMLAQKQKGKPTLSQLPKLACRIERDTQALNDIINSSDRVLHTRANINKISAEADVSSREEEELKEQHATIDRAYSKGAKHLADLTSYLAALTTLEKAWRSLRQKQNGHIDALQKSCVTLADNIKRQLPHLTTALRELSPEESKLLSITSWPFDINTLEIHQRQLTELSSRLDQALLAQDEAAEKSVQLNAIKVKINRMCISSGKIIESLAAIDPTLITNIKPSLDLIIGHYQSESEELSYHSGILHKINQINQAASAAQTKIDALLSSLRSTITEKTTQIKWQLAGLKPDTTLADQFHQNIDSNPVDSTLTSHQQRIMQLDTFSTTVAQAIVSKQQHAVEEARREKEHADAETAKEDAILQEALAALETNIAQLNSLASSLNHYSEILPESPALPQITPQLLTDYNKLASQLTPPKSRSLFSTLFNRNRPSQQLKILQYAPTDSKSTNIGDIKALTTASTDIIRAMTLTKKSVNTSLKTAIQQNYDKLTDDELLVGERQQLDQLTLEAKKKSAELSDRASLLNKFTTLSHQIEARKEEEAKIKQLRKSIKVRGKSLLNQYNETPSIHESLTEINKKLTLLKQEHATAHGYAALLNELTAAESIAGTQTEIQPETASNSLFNGQHTPMIRQEQGTEIFEQFREALSDLQESLDACYETTLKRTVTPDENEYFDHLRRLLLNAPQSLPTKPVTNATITAYNSEIMKVLNPSADRQQTEGSCAGFYVETAAAATKPRFRPKMLTKIESIEIAYCEKYRRIAAKLSDSKGQAAAERKLPLQMSA
jgi:hypothetical protein